MTRFVPTAVCIALLALSGCSANAGAGDAPPTSAALPSVEELSPMAPEETELRDAMGELTVIEVENKDGVLVPVAVPVEAMCDSSDCALRAAYFFTSFEDDVVSGRLSDQWDALSGSECFFCDDTLAVRDEFLEAQLVATGGVFTLVDQPIIAGREIVTADSAYARFVEMGDTVVSLVLTVEQSAIHYKYPDGTESARESAVVTMLMAVSWNGQYWTVEGVVLT